MGYPRSTQGTGVMLPHVSPCPRVPLTPRFSPVGINFSISCTCPVLTALAALGSLGENPAVCVVPPRGGQSQIHTFFPQTKRPQVRRLEVGQGWPRTGMLPMGNKRGTHGRGEEIPLEGELGYRPSH